MDSTLGCTALVWLTRRWGALWLLARYSQVVMLSSMQDRPTAPISNPQREIGQFTQQTRQASYIFVLLLPMHQIIILIIVIIIVVFTAILTKNLP